MAPTRNGSPHRLSRALGDHSRPVFTVLRTVRPIIATRRFGVVTRADDVREVLADFAHFGVPAYNEKMTAISGPFILGLDDTPLYRHDHQALRAAIRREDSAGLAERTLAARGIACAATDGQIDVVRELADPTIDAVMSEYFGTPGTRYGDPAALGARHLHRRLSQCRKQPRSARTCAGRRGRDAAPPRRADRCAAGERSTRATPARRRAHPPAASTRPADGGLHDIAIRHNLIGLIAGWIPTVSKAFACAVDELLRRPEGARERAGGGACGDHEHRGRLRLRSTAFPAADVGAAAHVRADQTVAADTRRATRLRAGATCSSPPSRPCSMAAACARRGRSGSTGHSTATCISATACTCASGGRSTGSTCRPWQSPCSRGRRSPCA